MSMYVNKLSNGFTVEYPKAGSTYRDETRVFLTWDEAVAFMKGFDWNARKDTD